MTFPITESISAATAVVSAGAAWLALLISRQANATAITVAAIERQRWHQDQTPDISVDCVIPSAEVSRPKLTLRLNGPAPLDQVTVTIRDDRPHPAGVAQRTEEESAELSTVVWGPWRFERCDQVSEHQRVGNFGRLPVDESRVFRMVESGWPSWDNRERWQQKYAGKPLRLTIECRRDGHEEPWVLQREVQVTTE